MFLCVRRFVEELIVGSPVHPVRSFGKWFGEISTPAKAHSHLLRSRNRSIPWDLPLALVSQAAATSAREYGSSAQVKLCHATTAGPAADRGAASKPGTRTAEVAARPFNRHPLLGGSPLATSLDAQDNSEGFGPYINAAQGHAVTGPGVREP
jgi:hypothetical protein